MPVETRGVRHARHPGSKCQLAQDELCVGPGLALLPLQDFRSGGRADQRVVERRAAAVHDDSLAPRGTDLEFRPGLRATAADGSVSSPASCW